MGKKWLPEKQSYDPAQMWITHNTLAITTDSWNSVGLALGYIKVNNDYFFGLAADKVYGRLLMGQGLYIQNTSGTYTINNDGLAAKNGSYQVKINPNQPTEIFSISIDNKKLLYVDANNKKLKFEGDIESKSGHIASYVISANDLTSGKVGMSSATAADAVSFWAGNTDRNNAPFRVTNQGKLTCSAGRIANYSISANDLISGNVGMSSTTSSGAVAFWAGSTSRNSAPFRVTNQGNVSCSNLAITGGSITLGSSFSVNSSGNMKASDADISGKVTASSGKIGGWSIEGSDLRGSSGSYIKGGEINMGSGFFRASDGYLGLGRFEVTDTTRGVLQSKDEVTGMSCDTSEDKEWFLWAGYGHGQAGEEALFLVNSGQVRCGGKLIVKKVDILDEIDKLWSAINSGCRKDGGETPCDGGGETPCNSGGGDPCTGDGDCSREAEGPGCYLGV